MYCDGINNKQRTWRQVADPEHHTTLMYTSFLARDNNPNLSAYFLQRILRNMMTHKGSAYSIDGAFEPCEPLAPVKPDIGAEGENTAALLSARLERAKSFGQESKKIKAVLFDCDSILAGGECATTLKPGAKQLLRLLKKNGIKAAIVSNNDKPDPLNLKNALLPEREFSNIVTVASLEGTQAKPSAESVYAVLKELDLGPDQAASTLMVSDQMKSNLRAAQAAGCQICLVGDRDKQALLDNSRLLDESSNDHTTRQLKDTGQRIHHANDLGGLNTLFTRYLQNQPSGFSL